MRGSGIVCVFFDVQGYDSETDCFAGEPPHVLADEGWFRAVEEGFVLDGWVR